MNENFSNPTLYATNATFITNNLGPNQLQGYFTGAPQQQPLQAQIHTMGYPPNLNPSHVVYPPPAPLSPRNVAEFGYYRQHLSQQPQLPQYAHQGIPQMRALYGGMPTSQSMFQMHQQPPQTVQYPLPSVHQVMPQHPSFVMSSSQAGGFTVQSQNPPSNFINSYPPNIYPTVATKDYQTSQPPSHLPSPYYNFPSAPFTSPLSTSQPTYSSTIPTTVIETATQAKDRDGGRETYLSRPKNVLTFLDPKTGVNVLNPDIEPVTKDEIPLQTAANEHVIEVDKTVEALANSSVTDKIEDQTPAKTCVAELRISENVHLPDMSDSSCQKDGELNDQKDPAPPASQESESSVIPCPLSESDSLAKPLPDFASDEKQDDVFYPPENDSSLPAHYDSIPVSEETCDNPPDICAPFKPSEVSLPGSGFQTHRYSIHTLLELAHLPTCLKSPPNLPPVACVSQCQVPSEYLDKVRLQAMINNGKPDRPNQDMSGYRNFNRTPVFTRRQPTVITLPQHEVGFREVANAYTPQFKSKAVMDNAERLQRDIKCLLNKLTPENFDRICAQIAALNIQTMDDMLQLCNLIFDKATQERKYTSTFAKLVSELKTRISIPGDKGPISFKNPVIRYCQDLFERSIGDYLQGQEKLLDEEIKSETDERVRTILQGNKQDKLKRKEEQYYGNMRFIGELIKLGVISSQIAGICLEKLLHESVCALDCLCELFFTVGHIVDSSPRPNQNETAFQFIQKMAYNESLETRIRCKLLDLIEMRARGWKKREIQEKLSNVPMTLEELRQKTEEEARQKEGFFRKEQSCAWNSNQSLSNIPVGGLSLGRSHSRNQPLNAAALCLSEKSIDTKSMITGPDGARRWDQGSRVTQRQTSSVGYPQDVRLSQSTSDYHIPKNRQQLPFRQGRTQSPVTSRTARKLATQYSFHGDGTNSSTGTSGRSTPTHQSFPRNQYHQSNEGGITFQATGASTPHFKDLDRPSSRAESSVTSDTAALKIMDPEALQDKCSSAFSEYIASGCFEEPTFRLHPEDHRVMVEMLISSSFEERDSSSRFKAGEFIRHLIDNQYLAPSSLAEGVARIITSSEDLLTDIPELWQYLGDVLEAFLVDENSRIDFLLELRSPPEAFIDQSLTQMLRLAARRLGEETVTSVFHQSNLAWAILLPPTGAIDVVNFLEQHCLSFLGKESIGQSLGSQLHDPQQIMTSGSASFSDVPPGRLLNNISPDPSLSNCSRFPESSTENA